MVIPRRKLFSRMKTKRRNSPAAANESLAVLTHLTRQKTLTSAASDRKKIRPTSAMRINAYAVPLRERIVIISNKGRYIRKYAYKNSNALFEGKSSRKVNKALSEIQRFLLGMEALAENRFLKIETLVDMLQSQNVFAESKAFVEKMNSVAGLYQENSKQYQNNNDQYENNNKKFLKNNELHRNSNRKYKTYNEQFQRNNEQYRTNNEKYQENNIKYQTNNELYENNNNELEKSNERFEKNNEQYEKNNEQLGKHYMQSAKNNEQLEKNNEQYKKNIEECEKNNEKNNEYYEKNNKNYENYNEQYKELIKQNRNKLLNYTETTINLIWQEGLRYKSNELQNHTKNCQTCSHLHSVILSLFRQSIITDKYPEYRSKNKRLKSFESNSNWNNLNDALCTNESKEKCESDLIKEGFFYDSKVQKFRCFSCGLLRDVLNHKEQIYLKYHFESGLYCSHNVRITIKSLLKTCSNDSQNSHNGEVTLGLCEALITAGFDDWKPKTDIETNCPWIDRMTETSSHDIVKGVFNILQFTGFSNDVASFLNRLLTFNDESWDSRVISLCKYGLFCPDRKKFIVKCCACDLEIQDYREINDDNDPWKAHIQEAQKNKSHKIKCSFYGMDQFSENINAKILNNLDQANWYPSNKFWRCKSCNTRLLSIDSNLENINMFKVHAQKQEIPICKSLANKTNLYYEFIKNGENSLDEIIKALESTFFGELPNWKKLSEYGFQADKNSECFCFCCFKRYLVDEIPLGSETDTLSADNIWLMHDGKGLNCEFATLKMPEELLYRLEYQEQYNKDDDSYQFIESLVKRRLEFAALFQECKLTFGTIYFQDESKSQRLFDANYIICNDMIHTANLFKCVKECKEIHYSCVISVFDDEKNEDRPNLKKFFDTMIHIYDKLSPEKGILFLTEGSNTYLMRMLGNAIMERKATKCQPLSVQSQETKDIHFFPHIKVLGICSVNDKSLFCKKQRKRIKEQVKLFKPVTSQPKNNNTDEIMALNPNHTEFIFLEDKNKTFQITDESRCKIHEQILSIVSRNSKENGTVGTKTNNNVSDGDKNNEIFSAIVITSGNENVVEKFTGTGKENHHVIICSNTGGTIYQQAKKCDECDQKRPQLTVVDMTLPDTFTMNMFAIFFSLFKSQLVTLNLLSESNSDHVLFKKELQKLNSRDLIERNDNSDEVIKAIVSESKLKELKDLLNNNNMLKRFSINCGNNNKCNDNGYYNSKNNKLDNSNGNSNINRKRNIERPIETLFIWAILTDRSSLAKFFLGNCKKIVVMSLAATYLLRLKKKETPFYKATYKRQVKELKENYENIAIGVLDCAYLKKGLKNEVFQTLQNKHEQLSHSSVIDVATMAKSKRIFKTDAFGNMMDNMWYSDYTTVMYLPQNHTGDNKKDRQVSPVKKFAMSLFCFVAFLIYYVIVLLLLYEGRSTVVLEGIIFFWIVGLVFEKSYEIAQRGYLDKSFYSFLDAFIIIIGCLAFFIGLSTYEFVKYFYWFNGILLIFRLFREFAAFKFLGPKLTMIFIMMKQLVKFSIILITVLALFSITYSMFPSSSEEISFFKPFFLIGQMIYEFDEISQAQQACFTNNTGSAVNNSDGSCAAFVLKFITSATFIYVVNLLVLNFLIALFASVYEIYTAKSEQLWRLGFYRLIEKYKLNPTLPIPFCIGEILFHVLCYLFDKLKQNRIGGNQEKNLSKIEYNFDEQSCYHEYLESMRNSQKNFVNTN